MHVRRLVLGPAGEEGCEPTPAERRRRSGRLWCRPLCGEYRPVWSRKPPPVTPLIYVNALMLFQRERRTGGVLDGWMDGAFKWTEIMSNLSFFPTLDLLNLRLTEADLHILCGNVDRV